MTDYLTFQTSSPEQSISVNEVSKPLFTFIINAELHKSQNTLMDIDHHYSNACIPPAPTSSANYNHNSNVSSTASTIPTTPPISPLATATPRKINELQDQSILKSLNSTDSTDSADSGPSMHDSTQTPQALLHLVASWQPVDPQDKPPYSYATLIAHAILSSTNRRLTLSEIYSWITTHYPYYSAGEHGWQNSIRHNLSLNKAFVKLDRTSSKTTLCGKGSFWTIQLGSEKPFIENLVKRRGPTRKQSVAMDRAVSHRRSRRYPDSDKDTVHRVANNFPLFTTFRMSPIQKTKKIKRTKAQSIESQVLQLNVKSTPKPKPKPKPKPNVNVNVKLHSQSEQLRPLLLFTATTTKDTNVENAGSISQQSRWNRRPDDKESQDKRHENENDSDCDSGVDFRNASLPYSAKSSVSFVSKKNSASESSNWIQSREHYHPHQSWSSGGGCLPTLLRSSPFDLPFSSSPSFSSSSSSSSSSVSSGSFGGSDTSMILDHIPPFFQQQRDETFCDSSSSSLSGYPTTTSPGTSHISRRHLLLDHTTLSWSPAQAQFVNVRGSSSLNYAYDNTTNINTNTNTNTNDDGGDDKNNNNEPCLLGLGTATASLIGSLDWGF